MLANTVPQVPTRNSHLPAGPSCSPSFCDSCTSSVVPSPSTWTVAPTIIIAMPNNAVTA